MADRLQVDLDGLSALGARLLDIGRELDSAKALLHGADHAVGTDKVAGALHDFEDHWHDGRKHLKDNAEALGSMASDSVDAYRQADDRLAEAIRESMSGATSGPR